MTLGLLASLRNTRLNNLTTNIDAGAGAGKLRVYDGTRPATGGTATNLLAELTFSKPSFPAASAGAMTASAITSATAAATGTATWCRVIDSTGAFVMDGSVSTSGAEYNLNTVSIVSGVQVSCTSCVLTEGNP